MKDGDLTQLALAVHARLAELNLLPLTPLSQSSISPSVSSSTIAQIIKSFIQQEKSSPSKPSFALEQLRKARERVGWIEYDSEDSANEEAIEEDVKRAIRRQIQEEKEAERRRRREQDRLYAARRSSLYGEGSDDGIPPWEMQWERHVKSVMGEEGGVDDIVSQERAEAAMYDHLYCEGREVQFYAMERMDYEMQLVDAERSGEATYSYDTPHDVDEFEPGEAEAYAIIAEVEEWRNRCLTEERAAFPVGYALHVEQVVEAEVPGEEARWEDGEAEYYSKIAEEIAEETRAGSGAVSYHQHQQHRRCMEDKIPEEEARWEDGEAAYYSKVAEEIAKSTRAGSGAVSYHQHQQHRRCMEDKIPEEEARWEDGEAAYYSKVAEEIAKSTRAGSGAVSYHQHQQHRRRMKGEIPGEEAQWEDGEAEYYSKVAEEIAKSNRVVTEPVMHQQHHQGRTVEVERVGDRSSNSGFSEKVNNEVLVDKRIPTEGGKNRSDEAMQYRLWVDEFRMSV